MNKRQKQTWLQRESSKRLIASEKIGNEGLMAIRDIYDEALKLVNKEITAIYSKYANETGMAVDDLALILNRSEKTKFLASIRRTIERLGFDVETVYQPKYLAQLTRLDKIKEQIYWQIADLATKERVISRRTYKDVIESSYAQMQSDLKFVGIQPSFTRIDHDILVEILADEWEGGMYSTRIWGNVGDMASKVKNILGSALLTGQSYEKTARLVRDRFKVGKSDALRLVRTETNYFHNQAEAQACKDDQITRYQFDAVMDGKTSETCQEHNGKKYYFKDKEVGVNYPPLHPNCRSTIFPLLPSETEYKRLRAIKQ